MLTLIAVSALFWTAVAMVVWTGANRHSNTLSKGRLKKKPVMITVKPYETLIGEGLSGAGFHFEWDGHRFIGCSLHQFEGRTPAEMIPLSDEKNANVKVEKRVYKQKDVQILTYTSAFLDAVKPLIYRPGISLSSGDPVIMINLDQQIAGHITEIERAPRSAEFEVEKPFEAQGCSGSPVVSGLTGTVVGVALTADSPDAARLVGFEILDLPESIKH
ncbi:MAG: hypothetical protein HY318_06345 [Armatimonadetes bacterium]|nr:hypothetical protein [Armatimonadota bacterium]